MREKLYAYQISKRVMTIVDVPEKYRDKVMGLLGESDRERNLAILAASTGD